MSLEDGAWFGSLTREEFEAGGAWILGDRPHCLDPGFPGLVPSSRGVQVKLWLAHPGKYAGAKYPMKNRTTEDLWEYVRVLTGQLDCVVRYDQDEFTYRLTCLDSGVDLPPYAERIWELPGRTSVASGVTILRRNRGHQAGDGTGYELRLWDAERQPDYEALNGPVNLPLWHYQLIVPFYGGCFLLPGLCKPGCHVLSHGYVFLPRQDRNRWTVRPSFQSRGIVIYF